jgi:glycosyltransferase involved in cell wall biosynthesis
VFGQDNLSRVYRVDGSGAVAMPLVGAVRARGLTTFELASDLKRKYIKDPKVTVEVETYRPFFILGEVNKPGQYPSVNAMTVEAAVAIAEGYTERAKQRFVHLTRRFGGVMSTVMVPTDYPVQPGALFTSSNASSKAHGGTFPATQRPGLVSSNFRILHCLRAPVGGLFRHVHDLAIGQAELGAEVGVICDSHGSGDELNVALSRLADNCALGVTRIPMTRQLGLNDWHTYRKIAKLAGKLDMDVLHGHGVKGGAYARLAGRKLKRRRKGTKVVYTPHGGVLHYSPSTLTGRLYLAAERKLAPLTDGMIFESLFAGNCYAEMIGPPPCPARIIPNGLYRHEFYESLLADDAADFVFIGELRKLKGVDVFLEALAAHQTIFPGRAIIVGSGPDEKYFRRLARRLGLSSRVAFTGPQPARTAFVRARCVVVPSRAESFPYIVLEAAAAQMPLIATNVGGVPEIVGDVPMPLIPPGDVAALAGQLRNFLADPMPFLRRAAQLQKYVAEHFTVEAMTRDVVDFYISGLGAGIHKLPELDPATAS